MLPLRVGLPVVSVVVTVVVVVVCKTGRVVKVVMDKASEVLDKLAVVAEDTLQLLDSL